jgi:hypothetical protein
MFWKNKGSLQNLNTFDLQLKDSANIVYTCMQMVNDTCWNCSRNEGRGDQGEWWMGWIQVRYIQYIVRTFVNAIQHNNKKKVEDVVPRCMKLKMKFWPQTEKYAKFKMNEKYWAFEKWIAWHCFKM